MKKILSVFLSFLIVISCFLPVSVSAAESVDINTSSVEDDLKSDYGNLSLRFPKNTFDTKMYLVSLMEYGYSGLGQKDEDYGLYLYVYNPSGKDISADANKVQFGVKWEDDGKGNLVAVDYKKYVLTLLDKNDDNTLIKLKVREPDSALLCKIGEARRYDISGIEIHEKKYTYKDYTVGYSYTFTGYGKGMSAGTMFKSTLKCELESFLTLKVDAHQVSYLSGDSAKDAAGYSNQVNSVYFSIPSDIEEKYGDLYSIKYEYYHYYTSPMIVTDNETSYNTLLADLGKKVDDTWEYSLSYLGGVISGSPGAPATTYNYYYNYGKEYEDGLLIYYNYYNSLPFLTTVFYDSDGWKEGDIIVDASSLEAYFKAYNSSYWNGYAFDFSADLFDIDKSKGYKVEEKSIDDQFSLASYEDTHKNKFLSWLFNGIWDTSKYDNSINNARYIEKVNADVLKSSAPDNYLVDSNQIAELRAFYEAQNFAGNNVYLLRYAAADDYYSVDLESNGLDGNFLMAQGNVYLNFDFIYFTFGDKENHTVIAVVSDPTNGFPNLSDTTPGGCRDIDYKAILAMLFALLIAFLFVFYVLPFVKNVIKSISGKSDKSPKPPSSQPKKTKNPLKKIKRKTTKKKRK